MSAENGETAPWRRSVEVRLSMLEAAGELYQEGLTEQRAVTTAMDADVSSVQNGFRAQRGLLQLQDHHGPAAPGKRWRR